MSKDHQPPKFITRPGGKTQFFRGKSDIPNNLTTMLVSISIILVIVIAIIVVTWMELNRQAQTVTGISTEISVVLVIDNNIAYATFDAGVASEGILTFTIEIRANGIPIWSNQMTSGTVVNSPTLSIKKGETISVYINDQFATEAVENSMYLFEGILKVNQ